MSKYKHAFWRFIYKLHRYIGLLSAIFLINLSVTGILLNHSQDLALDKSNIGDTYILDWYGIEAGEINRSFLTETARISQLENKVYFNQQFILDSQQTLLGVVSSRHYLLLAFTDSLLMMSHSAETIESFQQSNVLKIGLDNHQQIILATTQDQYLSSNDDLLSWHRIQLPETVLWSESSPVPQTLQKQIQTNYRQHILTTEKFILDLHSGQLFGEAGKWLTDGIAVILILLSLTGCSIWIKHKIKSLIHYKKINR